MIENEQTAILLIHCPDKPGILAAVTEFINQHQGNILYLDQYVNREEKVFFMRVEWDLSSFQIPKDKIEEYFRTLLGLRFDMNFSLYFSEVRPRMAIFVSKMSHCLYDLLARYAAGEWKVDIPVIISNHPDMEHVAKRFDIEYHYLPVNAANKAEQEARELELLKAHKITFCVLARYMQILSPEFIDSFSGRIINIHHSFLPAFAGARPYHAAHERGVKIIGATSHYVTSELDAGPIIEQKVAQISHKDTVEELIRKGRDLEKIVLSHAVDKHIDRKILTYKNRTIVFQ
ncbi:MAG: formyltetrahydrofolate deformylase [Paludibacter sp.]|mgnify:CR=1 FL=1|jgi:formyltetrahydrofolate deformylase|nr:formyltetrahydrofolate deformylase [Paludibacter sp.]MBP8023200.1 formyltetrahydrofolate deformylase [Paludibacter sp.]MBP8783199.1 formyltetrahydrofolate deformylase [Paludibacter sp.]